MKRILLIIGSLVVLFFVVLMIFYQAGLLIPPKLSFHHDQIDEIDRSLDPEEELAINRQKLIDRVLLLLNVEFKNSDIRWRVDNDKGFCFYDIVTPNINKDFIKSAKDGDKSALTRWNNLVHQMRIVQSGVQRMFIASEDDIGIVLSITDPSDTDVPFLSVANSIAGYDVVYGVDLLLDTETKSYVEEPSGFDTPVIDYEINDVVSADELLVQVREAIKGGIGKNERIVDVSFDGSDITIEVDLSDADTSITSVEYIAISRISSLTDPILDLDDKYTNTWNHVIVDFGDVGKAVLGKDLIEDGQYGKFFKVSEDLLQ